MGFPTFNITRGVKQGCPLSPTLLNIVLDPILRSIQQDGVQTLAWVDDIAILSNDKTKFTATFQRLTQLLLDAGMRLSVDTVVKNKTTYMTNDDNCENLGFPIQEPNGQISTFVLPKLEANKAYKYLGIHFTINLDWSCKKMFHT